MGTINRGKNVMEFFSFFFSKRGIIKHENSFFSFLLTAVQRKGVNNRGGCWKQSGKDCTDG